nr:PREDICTED: glutamic acid-rich protein-like isoform X1 [Bemisia tabaci]
MPNVELSTTKTVFILSIVLGCFAILWPKVFYPMFQTSVNQSPSRSFNSEGCCDVIFEKDVNVIKIMMDVCEKILRKSNDFDSKLSLAFQQGKLNKQIIEKCRSEVLEKCNVDISLFLTEKDKIGRGHKHILDEIRTFNSSFCMKYNFGVTPGLLGTPRLMRTFKEVQSKHQRPERLPHMRPELMHPALRERGRAILQSHVPHSHVVPRVENENVSPLPRPGPVPGMRPPMGAAGHVVPPPKTGSTVGILMPMYTICIVVFFVYTMLRILFRKEEERDLKDLPPDPEFRRVVFNEPKASPTPKANGKPQESSKLGDIEIDLLRKRLEETEAAMERIVKQMVSIPTPYPSAQPEESQVQGNAENKSVQKEDEGLDTKQVEEDIDKGAVKVVNIEMTESLTGGNRWSDSLTPRNRSPSPIPVTNPPVPEPIEIYLTGSVPTESKLLEAEKLSNLNPSLETEESLESGNDISSRLITMTAMGYSLLSKLKSLESEEEEPASEGELNDIKEAMEAEAKLGSRISSVEFSSSVDTVIEAGHLTEVKQNIDTERTEDEEVESDQDVKDETKLQKEDTDDEEEEEEDDEEEGDDEDEEEDEVEDDEREDESNNLKRTEMEKESVSAETAMNGKVNLSEKNQAKVENPESSESEESEEESEGSEELEESEESEEVEAETNSIRQRNRHAHR